jgi:hypothetical protein
MSCMWPWIQVGNIAEFTYALWARAQNLAMHYGAQYRIIDYSAESHELHLKACCIHKRKSETKKLYMYKLHYPSQNHPMIETPPSLENKLFCVMGHCAE